MKKIEIIITILMVSFVYALVSGADSVAILIAVATMIVSGVRELFTDNQNKA